MIIGSSTFSKADIVANRLNVWNTNPAPRNGRLHGGRECKSTNLFQTKICEKGIFRVAIDSRVKYFWRKRAINFGGGGKKINRPSPPAVGASMHPIMFSKVVFPPPTFRSQWRRGKKSNQKGHGGQRILLAEQERIRNSDASECREALSQTPLRQPTDILDGQASKFYHSPKALRNAPLLMCVKMITGSPRTLPRPERNWSRSAIFPKIWWSPGLVQDVKPPKVFVSNWIKHKKPNK